MVKSYTEFCRKSVQKHDPDRYLLSLLVGGGHAAALWAVFAFHHEIAKTRLVVSEPTLGLIRLQWWRDEIAKIYEMKPYASGEVLAALAEAIDDYDIPQEMLEALILAREIEVRGEQPEGVDGALRFIDMVQEPLLNIVVTICGGDLQSDPVSAVALNYGLVDVLRRADEKSLVGQNRDVFVESFAPGVRSDNKALRAMQAISEVWFSHVKNGLKDRPPALLALRVWGKCLF